MNTIIKCYLWLTKCVLVFRMAPNSSKHYPITTSVFSYIPPSSCKRRRISSASCQLDSSTSLAHLGKNHVDSYIKQIIRHVKNLVFKKLPDAVVSKDWSVFAFNQGAPGLNGTVKIEEFMHVQPSSMLEALTFLNVCFLHSENLLTNITEFCKAPQIDVPELSKLKKLKEHLVELTAFLEHQSLLAWAQHYIESLFTYDIFLTECVLKYPYKDKKVNEWFSVPVERDDNDEDGIATNVQVINTTQDKLSTLIEEKEQQCQQQPGQRLYYHGTDHNSAKSLLEDGIKLEKGKPCSDFSDGKGFYVADNAMFTFEWAKKSKAPAVVMFTITDDCLNKKFKGLDLSSADRKSDWEMIKNYFRKKNKQLSANRKLLKECNKSDYIKGPISRDGTEQKQQICIRKDGMAEDIGNLRNICVVFINAT